MHLLCLAEGKAVFRCVDFGAPLEAGREEGGRDALFHTLFPMQLAGVCNPDLFCPVAYFPFPQAERVAGRSSKALNPNGSSD